MRKKELIKQNAYLKREIVCLKKALNFLKDSHAEQESFIKEIASDGLRHGSPISGNFMSSLNKRNASK